MIGFTYDIDSALVKIVCESYHFLQNLINPNSSFKNLRQQKPINSLQFQLQILQIHTVFYRF
jgi:hypothetical protein